MHKDRTEKQARHPAPRQGNTISKTVGRIARDFFGGLILFVAVFAMAALDSEQAWPHPAQTSQALNLVSDTIIPQIVRNDTRLPQVITGIPERNARHKRVIAQGYLPPTITPEASGISIFGQANGNSEVASSSWRFSLVAIMALIFGGMSALTMHLWRHLRHEYQPPPQSRRRD